MPKIVWHAIKDTMKKLVSDYGSRYAQQPEPQPTKSTQKPAAHPRPYDDDNVPIKDLTWD